MKSITRTFLTGLGTVLPLFATIYLLYWFVSSLESWLGRAIRQLLGEQYYVPGLGIVLGILLIFAIGLLTRIWLVRKLFRIWDNLLQRMPIFNSIYRAFQDLIGFVTKSKKTEERQVVLLRLGDSDMRVVGLVTRTDLTTLPAGFAENASVAVYVPMSYQLGGYTVFVPRSQIQPVDLSMQDAMRLAITAGMSTS